MARKKKKIVVPELIVSDTVVIEKPNIVAEIRIRLMDGGSILIDYPKDVYFLCADMLIQTQRKLLDIELEKTQADNVVGM